MRRDAFLISLAGALLPGCGGSRAIRVGSKNFTEQLILGELIAQLLEAKLGARVSRRLNLGGTLLAHQAMLHGELDLYPEYTGTAYAAILHESGLHDAGAVFAKVRSTYEKNFGLRWLDPLGFDNTFAVVIRGEDARKLAIRKLSEASQAAVRWRLGVGYEFSKRADGLQALTSTYPSVHWDGSPTSMDLGLLYRALDQGQVSMAVGSSTDGALTAHDFVVLDDDLHAFGPYQACIVTKADRLREVPGLEETLTKLSGRISTEAMRRLNFKADGEHQKLADVAAGFVKELNL
jgi:osmoprotectant transport system substrate-binding protein